MIFEVPDDFEAGNESCIRRGWTDGLPVVPPMFERVERMLTYCDRRARGEVAGGGYPKNTVKEYLFEYARVPLGKFAEENVRRRLRVKFGANASVRAIAMPTSDAWETHGLLSKR